MLQTPLRQSPTPPASARPGAASALSPAGTPWSRWKVIAAGSLTLCLAGGGWLSWHQGQVRARQAALLAQTAVVERSNVVLQVTASGSIRPTTPVNISPKQPGRVTALFVDQGDRVSAGQVLARMDDSNLRGTLQSALGTLVAAEANLQKLRAGNRPQEIEAARRNLEAAEADQIAVRSTFLSNQQLYRSGAIARVSFDASRSAFLASEARVRSLRAQLNLASAGSRAEDITTAAAQVLQARGGLASIQAQVNDTVIRAPFAGVVSQKYADVGAFVTPTTSASATSSATSSSILALASELEAVANVAEVDVGAIRPGQPVDLQVDAFPRQVFRGTVRLVAPEAVVEQNVTSFQVRIALAADARSQLRSGMNLTANVRVGRRSDALLIPTPAIVSERDGTGVMRPGDNGEPSFQPVQVGVTIGNRTEVLRGLKAGDRVYLSVPGRRQPNARPVSGASPFQQQRGQGRMPR
ncbi:efflux RND transporter periplasmic adaptor subunit [Cyanobium gracile]|uniref:RND family efflux transporter, MFP subunit n=1 Tax=Cyanobium gracile (strain ATCC 27147 / PCC 6307) TaxID=292564 RepID=K9P7Q7_CYAGP|nr:efflux RND transporter periplasmic adaptor subunit [Cyanobium gracile]AFY29150.1 RND family efflux transporter, MFP subunit [Cyanobium gracile PCC 6307]